MIEERKNRKFVGDCGGSNLCGLFAIVCVDVCIKVYAKHGRQKQ